MVNCCFCPACGAVSHQIRLFIIANGKDGGQNTDPAFCEYQDRVIPLDKTKKCMFGRASPPKYNTPISKAFIGNDGTV